MAEKSNFLLIFLMLLIIALIFYTTIMLKTEAASCYFNPEVYLIQGYEKAIDSPVQCTCWNEKGASHSFGTQLNISIFDTRTETPLEADLSGFSDVFYTIENEGV